MPRTSKGILPFLLPALVLVPLAGLFVFLFEARWHAADVRQAVSARVADAAATMGRQLDAAVQRQASATEALGRSPMAWLWVKFQGERLSPSNRSHAQMALDEAVNYSRLLPGTTVYFASEKTRTLYQAGAAVEALSRTEPRDSWYAACLKAEGVVLSAEPGIVRASVRVMDGRQVIGAVTSVRDAAHLAEEALAAGQPGLGVVLTDAQGAVALARGTASAATIFDLYPGTPQETIRADMEAARRTGEVRVSSLRAKNGTVRTAVARTSAPGWLLFVSSELRPQLPPARGVALAATLAIALALILAALALIALGRERAAGARLRQLEHERDSSVGAARETAAAAQRARATAQQLQAAARTLSAEALSAGRSVAEASDIVGQAEERAAELRAGIAARLSLLTELLGAARDAVEKGRAADGAAEGIGGRARAAEEELSRVIASGTAVTHAVERAGKGVTAVQEAAEQAKLLALNAALEASRAAGPGGARVADTLRGLAERVAEEVQALSAALGEARAGMRVIGRASQDAGQAIHEASELASGPLQVPQAGWRTVQEALARLDAAGLNAARIREEAVASDQGRSATEGIGKIVARVQALTAEIEALAAAVAAETGRAAPLTMPSR